MSISLRQSAKHARSILYHPKVFFHYISQRSSWKELLSWQRKCQLCVPGLINNVCQRRGNCYLTFYQGSSIQGRLSTNLVIFRTVKRIACVVDFPITGEEERDWSQMALHHEQEGKRYMDCYICYFFLSYKDLSVT